MILPCLLLMNCWNCLLSSTFLTIQIALYNSIHWWFQWPAKGCYFGDQLQFHWNEMQLWYKHATFLGKCDVKAYNLRLCTMLQHNSSCSTGLVLVRDIQGEGAYYKDTANDTTQVCDETGEWSLSCFPHQHLHTEKKSCWVVSDLWVNSDSWESGSITFQTLIP